MASCDVCGKGVQIGHLIRHNHSGQWEKRATKKRKIFMPNIQKGKILINGVLKNVRACASCLAKNRVPYSALQKTSKLIAQ